MHRGRLAPASALRGEKCSPSHRLPAILLAILLAAPPADAGAIVSEAREILGAGDEIDGVGRIGLEDFAVVGIAADDHVVFTGGTSTGARGVFTTSAEGVQMLWLATDPEDHPVRLGRIRANANRVVVAAGHDPTDVFFNAIVGLYQVSFGTLVPVVELGDMTPEGDEICNLADFVVSDTGAVAFSAYAAPSGVQCDFKALSENLYVFEAGVIRRLLRTDAELPTLELVGLADDGTLVVNLSDGSAILAVGEGRLDRIVSSVDSSPRGAPFGSVRDAASNSLGEVAFFGDSGTTLYRTHQGSILRVAENGDLIEQAYFLDGFHSSSASINDAGAVVVRVQLDRVEGSPLQAAVLFPPGGAPARVLAPFGIPAGINDRGTVAVLEENVELGREGDEFVARGIAAPLERLVGVGDEAPDGGFFAIDGIGGSTLAPDGRIATLVYSGSRLSRTLTCGDADGFVALTGPSNPTREGASVAPAGPFALAQTGLLFFGVEPDEPVRLYLASDTGLERVLGTGDMTSDGARIEALVSFSQDVPGNDFASNSRGTVLVRARTDRGVRFVRRQPTGELESIAFDTGVNLPILRNISADLFDDDTVIVTVHLEDDEYAVLASDGTSTRLLAVGSDPLLPEGPFHYMTILGVAGDRAFIRAEKADNSAVLTLSYTEEAGFLSFFRDQVDGFFAQGTAGGRALVERFAGGTATQFLLSPDGSATQLTESRFMGEPQAIAINDRDNVLFLIDGNRLGTRQHLSLSGPPPSARCPRGPATVTPEPTVTPSPTPTETPEPTQTATPTETLAPTPSRTPTSTQTTAPTQTTTASGTSVPSATPVATPAAAPQDFDDGCQAAPASGTSAWPLLAMLALLVCAPRRR